MGKWLAVLLLVLLVGLTAAVPAGAVRFVDIGTTLNIPSADCVAWGDYDNDGYPDLYIGGHWAVHRAYLLHNEGDGAFTDVTLQMGLHVDSGSWQDENAVWGDFDNDGGLDLVVTSLGTHSPFVYHNDGDHFTDVAAAAGLASTPPGLGTAWGDYDGDNWLDLYAAAKLYHNNQDGTFTDVTSAAGMDLAPATLAASCTWVDYDNDGQLDLVVSRTQDASGNQQTARLYRNDGDGTFTDMALPAGLSASSTEAVAAGDYDNDGFLDLYLGGNQNRASLLEHNSGDGTFTNVYDTAMAVSANSCGAAWGDYDNDGFLDLAQANGYLPAYDETSPSVAYLFHNDHSGGFDEVSVAEGVTASRKFRGAAWADFNRDGLLDVVMACTDAYSCFYQNTGGASDGNWLRVRALTSGTGDATDGSPVRDALGARVWVNLDNDTSFPPGSTLQRIIDGGSGFLSQNEPIAHFGLGDATVVAVRVVFPDYSVITQTGVAADQQIEVRDTYQATGALEGTITAAEGGAAIYNAAVTCGHLTTRSSVTGAYRFPLVPSGVYEVAVTAEGYEAQTIPGVVVLSGETTTLDFALTPPNGAIAGHVTDAVTSAAIAGATVSAGGETTSTEGDGSYLLSDLAPGDYTVSATAAGYQEASHSGAVVSDETTTVDLALTPLSVGVVNGVVREAATTSPIAGAVVTCGSVRALTDWSGAYSFPAVAAGSYTVGAAAAGYWWSAAVTVEVEAGQTVTQDFVLTKMSGAGPQFEEINAGSMPGSLGAAWGDYDGDGYPDLFLGVNQFAPYGVALLHNDGDLTFTDITSQVGLPGVSTAYDGIAAGDYDNDGDLDVFVNGESGVAERLFRNDGDSFVDVAATAGVVWEGGGRTVAWGDYDADNWLDVVAGNPGGAPQLFHNDADGGFTNVTEALGLGDVGSNWGSVVWADFDSDGWLDLAGSWGYSASPHLCHNDEGEGFTEVPSAFVPPPSAPSSVAAGDFDNDGNVDLAFGNWPYSQGVQLLRNQGNGTFENVSIAAGVGGEGSYVDAVSWADCDNDGFLDLLANAPTASMRLYHNNGDGTFTDQAIAAGLSCPYDDKAAIWGDLDLDGRIDLLQAAQPTSQLFHNTGAAGNWLRVRALTDRDGAATDSDLGDDRDAIGARVELNVDNDGSFPPGRTLVRLISGGSGFLGQDEPIAQFGVPVTGPVAVRVIFVDGSTVVRRGVGVNQQFAVRDKAPEPSSSFWDIPSDYWALTAVEACVEAGIVQGYWDNSYRPTLAVTRDQMAVYVSRAIAGGDEGVQVPTGVVGPSFTDVDEDYWAYRYVEYCVGQNVVQGYWDGSYRPAVEVNRGQMAIYIARGMVAPGGDAAVPTPSAGHESFTDVSADNEWSWCYQHVEYLAGEDIVQGYWDNSYHPERVVTRDQMAVYVARAFELPL